MTCLKFFLSIILLLNKEIFSSLEDFLSFSIENDSFLQAGTRREKFKPQSNFIHNSNDNECVIPAVTTNRYSNDRVEKNICHDLAWFASFFSQIIDVLTAREQQTESEPGVHRKKSSINENQASPGTLLRFSFQKCIYPQIRGVVGSFCTTQGVYTYRNSHESSTIGFKPRQLMPWKFMLRFTVEFTFSPLPIC